MILTTTKKKKNGQGRIVDISAKKAQVSPIDIFQSQKNHREGNYRTKIQKLDSER
jgi:hypothetical protein